MCDGALGFGWGGGCYWLQASNRESAATRPASPVVSLIAGAQGRGTRPEGARPARGSPPSKRTWGTSRNIRRQEQLRGWQWNTGAMRGQQGFAAPVHRCRCLAAAGAHCCCCSGLACAGSPTTCLLMPVLPAATKGPAAFPHLVGLHAACCAPVLLGQRLVKALWGDVPMRRRGQRLATRCFPVLGVLRAGPRRGRGRAVSPEVRKVLAAGRALRTGPPA